MHALLLVLALTAATDSVPPRRARTIAVDARLATDGGLRLGDTVIVAAEPGGAGDTLVIAAFTKRRADPSEVARAEYRVRMHLEDVQRVLGYGDRVDRFAVATVGDSAAADAVARINAAAFGFRAHRSRDIAVESSRTFAVIDRFHKAIGLITIVASAIFLLCLMLLRVDARRREVAALRLMGISAASIVRSVVLESAIIAGVGSLLGTGVGYAASAVVNWYYQGVYRTPLLFAFVTPGIVAFAVTLSVALGLVTGALAARRLVRQPPLALLGR
ncbi:MAG: ABC transporter permease [Gemmatimonadetes bacterium]|nr:ABC transporter permease [Gemmatimonadota bacterium]